MTEQEIEQERSRHYDLQRSNNGPVAFRLTAPDGGDLEVEEQRQLRRPVTLWWL